MKSKSRGRKTASRWTNIFESHKKKLKFDAVGDSIVLRDNKTDPSIAFGDLEQLGNAFKEAGASIKVMAMTQKDT